MEDEEHQGHPAGAPAEPALPGPTFDRRDPRARMKLLERLPALVYHTLSLRDDLSFDDDWSGMANLKADSILGPLEEIATGRHRGGA